MPVAGTYRLLDEHFMCGQVLTAGTIVGDGTDYPITGDAPSLYMEPCGLDDKHEPLDFTPTKLKPGQHPATVPASDGAKKREELLKKGDNVFHPALPAINMAEQKPTPDPQASKKLQDVFTKTHNDQTLPKDK